MFIHRSTFNFLVIVLIMVVVLTGFGITDRGEAALALLHPYATSTPTLKTSILSTIQSSVHWKVQASSTPTDKPTNIQTAKPTDKPTVQPSPTASFLGTLFNPAVDIKAGPIDLPLELQIPSLDVNAPIIGVGLTSENVMDAPKGPADDPIWKTAFWYRGGGIPGDSGTATIAGHVDDPHGRPMIFAHLEDLHPGNLVVIHLVNTNTYIDFIVDEVKDYTSQEASDPAVLSRIFGSGPMNGTGPQPAADGLAHLNLITCAGAWVNGSFDHRTVVYTTIVN